MVAQLARLDGEGKTTRRCKTACDSEEREVRAHLGYTFSGVLEALCQF